MQSGGEGVPQQMDLSRANAGTRESPSHRAADMVNTHWAAAESTVTNE
jgi:hypothetical protein